MKKYCQRLCFLLSLIVIMSPVYLTAGGDLSGKLAGQPGLDVLEIDPPEGFVRAFQIMITQPLDHRHPDRGIFQQRMFLLHRDVSRPMVMVTEGYKTNARPRQTELAELLSANQLTVEHRFFGKSRPDSMNWQYLTIRQAADDHHQIIERFKRLYQGKWLTTGISKGGQTCLFHRRYYPDDVDVTVPYVAPIPLAPEDPRLDAFIEQSGDADCRDKIRRFQRRLLELRDEMIPMVEQWAEKHHQTFSIGIETAFEYGVLEYSFSFWQNTPGNCEEIPAARDSAEALFRHFAKIGGVSLYADRSIRRFQPFFYQAFTELGYYNYITGHLQDLLVAVPKPDNRIFAPPGVELTYRPEVMQDVHQWLVNSGNNILYIYGEQDTWTGAAVTPSAVTNALKMVKPKGWHNTRIRHFAPADQERIFTTLESWLDLSIERPAASMNTNFMLFNGLFLLLAVAGTLALVAWKSRDGRQRSPIASADDQQETSVS